MQSRRPVTYRVRVGAVVLALAILGLVQILNFSPNPTQRGLTVMTILTVLGMAYCFLEGLRGTSDCLSSERREGTLRLLFLTELKGYDVVAGKLAAASLNSFYGLLAILPILGITTLMGGVTGGDFWRVMLVLINTLVFCLSVGMWNSSRYEESMKSAAQTVQWLIIFIGIFPFIDRVAAMSGKQTPLELFSPGYACWMAFDLRYRAAPGSFWISNVMIFCASLVFLGLASRRVIRLSRDDPEKVIQSIEHQKSISSRVKAPPKSLLEKNPAQWLASYKTGGSKLLVVYCVLLVVSMLAALSTRVGTLAIVIGVNYSVYFITAWILVTLFVHQTNRIFFHGRKDGSLELLLSTPIQVEDVLKGQRQAMKTLMNIIIVVNAFLTGIRAIFWWLSSASSGMGLSGYLIMNLASIVSMVFMVHASTWVAMWQSLSTANQTRAIARTFFFTVIVPVLIVYVFIIPFQILSRFFGNWLWWPSTLTQLIEVGIYLGLLIWARKRLRTEFLNLWLGGFQPKGASH